MIKKHNLFLLSGALWTIAGSMILLTGIPAWMSYHPIYITISAIIIFLLFYTFVFSMLVKKHEKRIMSHPDSEMKWYQFFDKKSYIIMIIMMTLGITLRASGLLSIGFFAYFYLGLGVALLSCGIRFFAVYIRNKP